MDLTVARSWIGAAGRSFEDECDLLTRLDAAIGDADHGINMRRGFRAVEEALAGSEWLYLGELFQEVGKRLVVTVGGAAGPLYGVAFRRLGGALAGRGAVGLAGLTEGLEAALQGIQELGAAEPGDKTMVDAFLPAVDELRRGTSADTGLAEAVAAAAEAAEAGMRATIPMVARKGRASYLGERSEGHQDPGATSTALLFQALRRAVEGRA